MLTNEVKMLMRELIALKRAKEEALREQADELDIEIQQIEHLLAEDTAQ